MIISCFPFFNEIDLLKLRISCEYSFYNKIIIVEATKTHAGRDKILYFKKYQYLFEQYLDKIIYVVVDDMPNVIQQEYRGWNNLIAPEYRWHLEEHQRNCILRGLSELDLADEDLILVSDLDEIVNVEQVKKVANTIKAKEIHYFYLTDYRYTVQNKPKGYLWLGGYITRYQHFKKSDPSMLRTIAWYELTHNTLSWNQPINSLKYLKKWMQNKLINESSINPSQLKSQSEFKKSVLGSLSCQEMLKHCNLNKAIFHKNSGCHLSFMSGGYDQFLKLKVQNFSHSECYDGSPLEDTEMDIYVECKNYIDKNLKEKLYDFNDLDGDLPIFIREQVKSFPVLLSPITDK